MSGFCTVSICSATAACAPKLEDSTWVAGPCSSAQATRASASIASSRGLSASRSSAGWASLLAASFEVAAVMLMGDAPVRIRRGSGKRSGGHGFGFGRPDLDMGGIRRQGDEACTMQEVAEAFVRLASGRVLRQQRLQRLEDLRFGDVLAVEGVEALAAVVGAEHQVVAARGLADQGDLAQVGTGAAVGAAGDAQQDRCLGQAQLLQDGLQPAG